MQNPTKTARA